MRKNATKLAALALTLAMTVTSVALPNSASAATKTVKLNTTSKTLYATGSSAKKTTTLKVTVNGKKKTATFKSSNTKVATVGKTSGKVTAKKAGKATITATYGGKKVKCKITVKAKFVKVTSVSVSPKTVSLAVGKTKTIKTTVKPSKASIKKVTYASNKKSVATVNSAGKITAKKAGTAKVTVTATDGTKKKATVTVKVTKATTPTATPSATPDATPVPTETPAATATSASATAITSFKQTGAAKLTAEFSGAVSNAAKVEVTKDGKVVDGTVKFSDDKKSVVFEGKADFLTAEYVIKVTDGDKVLTEKVKAEAAKIADIKILGDTALTGKANETAGDNTAAYIYYDVVNQFGESMRESTEIDWTISSKTEQHVDKSTGRITISNKEGNDYKSYTYGTDIYVVGVNVQSGITVNKAIKIGMAQAIDTVEFKGFIDTKGDKTKFLQELPANFQKDRYVLCYAALDQNANQMEAVKYQTTDLTLLADKPLVVKSTFEASTPNTFTVGGVAYAGVKIQPGTYVDNGADVLFTMISNKTGKKSEKIFKVGTGAKLKSLTIQAPTDVVADGDANVTLNYVAKDTNGNETKSYETIVRSTNELTLNASQGTLRVEESDSGEAVIKWTDKDLSQKFTESSAWDNQPRIEAISTIVAGGESNNMTFNISDTRRPVAFKHIKLNGDDNNAVVSGNNGKIDLIGSDDVEYLDQYQAKLDKAKVDAFFKQAADSVNGFNGKNYAIQVKASGEERTKLNLAEEKIYEYGTDTLSYTASLGDRTKVDDYIAAQTPVETAKTEVGKAKKMLDLLKKVDEAKKEAMDALKAAKLEAEKMPASVTTEADLTAAKAQAQKAVDEVATALTKLDEVDTAADKTADSNKATNGTDGNFTYVDATPAVNIDVSTTINAATDYNTLSSTKGTALSTIESTTAVGNYSTLKDAIGALATEIGTLSDSQLLKAVDAYATKVGEENATTAGTGYGNLNLANKALADKEKLLGDAEKALNNVSERANVTVKFAIVAKKTGEGSDKYTAVSKVDTEDYTVLPIKEVKDRLAITFNADKLKAYASGKSEKVNGLDASLNATSDASGEYEPTLNFFTSNFNGKNIGEFVVKGTTGDGKVVTIPKSEYTNAANSQIIIGTKTGDENTATTYTTTADEVIKNLVVKIAGLKYGDFYDFNTASLVRKDATAKLVLDVYGVQVAKSIAVSDADAKAKEVKFTYKKKFATEGVVKAENTKIAALTNATKLDQDDDLHFVVLDQYNCPLSAAVSQTIANIKESETGFNHLPGSFAPVQNGTDKTSVDKAEIGDKYKLTVSVDGTTVSGSADVTVGSDKKAYVSSKEKDNDKTFRETYLNMKRDN